MARSTTLSDLIAANKNKRKPPGRIQEDDPRWNASTMGNRTGLYKGRWYEKGKKVPFDRRGQ